MNQTDFKDALHGLKIETQEVSGSLNLVCGKGINAHRLNLDFANVEPWLSNRTDALSYLDGLRDIVKESPRSPVHHWPFSKSAATLLPHVKHKAYIRATEHAAGSPALNIGLTDGLFLTFSVTTDFGVHVITEKQVDGWGVTISRVQAAARSMLFHHTRDVKQHSVSENVVRISSGDGHDPARFTVLEDLAWDRDEEVIVAFPDETAIYITNRLGLQELRELIAPIYEESATPVSRDVFTVKNYMLQPI